MERPGEEDDSGQSPGAAGNHREVVGREEVHPSAAGRTAASQAGRDAGVAFSLEETAKQKERHHTQAQGELSFYGSSQMQCKVVLVTFF